jgi:hypothetical protein
MAAQDPTYAQTHDATAWNAADGAAVTDILTCATDNVTNVNCVKQGKAPDDILRIQFPGLSTIAVGDTVSIHFSAIHNYGTMALVPYSSASGVTTTNRLTYVVSGGSPAVFTLTAAFIADLFDQGSGTWAARIVEDSEIAGDIGIDEVDSDLTLAAGGALISPYYSSYYSRMVA